MIFPVTDSFDETQREVCCAFHVTEPPWPISRLLVSITEPGVFHLTRDIDSLAMRLRATMTVRYVD